MKHFRCGLAMLLVLLSVAGIPGITGARADVSEKPATILFTHDLHGHFLPFPLERDGAVRRFGGLARRQSGLNSTWQKDPDLLLLDAGDFSMGTLFQTLFATEAPGLRLLGQMGYDALGRPNGIALTGYSLATVITALTVLFVVMLLRRRKRLIGMQK